MRAALRTSVARAVAAKIDFSQAAGGAYTYIDTYTGTNTATLGTHQSGDILVAIASRDGSSTAPSIPAAQNWGSALSTSGANSLSYVLVGKIAAGASEGVGTFTNATSVSIVHIRPGTGISPAFGATATSSLGSSINVSIPALSLSITDGSSIVLGFYLHASADIAGLTTPPSGMTHCKTNQDATDTQAIYRSTNQVSAWSAAAVSFTGTAGAVRTIALEICLPSPNDSTPNAFSFTDQTAVALSTLLESNTLTLAGTNVDAPISITGGEYSVNGAAYTSSSGTIAPGATFKVRHTSSGSNSTATNTVLTIGGVSDTFTSTTLSSGGSSESLNTVYLPSFVASGTYTMITWDAPTIVYPGIDVNYKMTGYDWFNRALTWSIDTGPAWLSIGSGTGVLTGTPPTDNSNHSVTVRLTPSGGAAVTKTFTIQVDADKCKFVSTSGSDAAAGTFAAPYRTHAYALSQCLQANTGFAIYARGGSYAENFDPVASNYWGRTGPNDANPVFWRNYPTESVSISIASGSGPSFYDLTRLVALNISISGGTGQEGGCFVGGSYCVFKRCNASDYNVGGSYNPTGFKIFGGDILDSCVGHGNYDRGGTTPQNWSNYLIFCDGYDREGFVIDCESYDSVCGFKFKHSGAATMHLHRCVSYDASNCYDMASDYSSIRYSLGVADATNGNLSAANFGNSSGTNSTIGGLLDACLLIAEVANSNGVDLGGGYYYSNSSVPAQIRANTIVALGTASTSYPGINWPFRRTSYGGDLPSAQNPAFTNNVIYSPSSSSVEYKNDNNVVTTLTLAQTNSETNSSGNTHSGAIGSSTLTFQGANYNWSYTAAGGLVKGAAL